MVIPHGSVQDAANYNASFPQMPQLLLSGNLL
jgi:hypothetical protein